MFGIRSYCGLGIECDVEEVQHVLSKIVVCLGLPIYFQPRLFDVGFYYWL